MLKNVNSNKSTHIIYYTNGLINAWKKMRNYLNSTLIDVGGLMHAAEKSGDFARAKNNGIRFFSPEYTLLLRLRRLGS